MTPNPVTYDTTISGISVEVWARHGKVYYWQMDNPMLIPRVGERIAFGDGLGVVDSVTWTPTDQGMVIRVECVPYSPPQLEAERLSEPKP